MNVWKRLPRSSLGRGRSAVDAQKSSVLERSAFECATARRACPNDHERGHAEGGADELLRPLEAAVLKLFLHEGKALKGERPQNVKRVRPP